ncbi:MAG: START domain-containing protein [Flavobacteriaceae bacterium]
MKPFFLSIILSICFLFSFSQEQWVLKEQEDGIRVYTRKTRKSSVKEFKAITVFQASIQSVIDKITDAEGLKHWNYKTTESRLIERVSDKEFIIYMYNNFPWPVKDRDHISKLTLSKIDSSSVRIDISSLPNRLPKIEGVIRIEEFSGYWLIEKTVNGIQVTQQMYGEPKGRVPSLIINATLAKAPLYSFKRLRDEFK